MTTADRTYYRETRQRKIPEQLRQSADMVRFFEELLHYRTHLHRTGEVFFWPTSVTVPLNTIPADGAAVSRTDYAALFSVYGTTVGAGNGTTTFNVPNVTAPSGTVALVQV